MSQAASATYGSMSIKRLALQDGVQQLKDKGYKILVVNLPITGEWILRRFFESCLGMCAGSAYQFFESQKVRMLVNICGDFPIDHNRNKGIRIALEQFGADYVMNLDTDQTFKPGTIIDLFTRMQTPAPDGSEIGVLAGVYHMKHPPFRPVLGPYTTGDEGLDNAYLDSLGFLCRGECGDARHATGEHQIVRWSGPHYMPEDKLFRADVIGVGCVLSRASMWQKLPYPFFRYSPDPLKGKDDPSPGTSEDMYWCAAMHKAGVKVWIDPAVQCGHLGILESNKGLCDGAFSAALAHVASLPDDSPDKINFNRSIVDVR